jgi:hypothetical protein
MTYLDLRHDEIHEKYHLFVTQNGKHPNTIIVPANVMFSNLIEVKRCWGLEIIYACVVDFKLALIL